MNITRENTTEQIALITLKLEQNDYQKKVNDVLKDYRKKARIDGFRPGMVPMGMIKNMYGTQVLVDELNKMVGEELPKYLHDEKLQILGDPLPSEKQKEIDFENAKDFEFLYEIAITPEFSVSLTKRDKYFIYDIKVDDEIITKQVEAYANQFGSIAQVDVVEEKSTIKGDMTQVDEKGEAIAEGVTVKDAIITVNTIKLKGIIKKFVGANKNEIITFNPKKAFKNDTEVAALLKITKEEVETLDADFQITISDITNYNLSEINEDLFKKVYPDGTTKTEEEFKAKIGKEIKKSLNSQSKFKFGLDAKEKLVSKISFDLPEEFLKRWLLATNKEATPEQIDTEFDAFTKDLHWQLIRNKIIRDNDIKVSEEEILEYAKVITRSQLAQYGMANLGEEQIESFAKMTLEKDEEKNRIVDGKYEEKVFDFIYDAVKVEQKEISTEEFNELFKTK